MADVQSVAADFAVSELKLMRRRGVKCSYGSQQSLQTLDHIRIKTEPAALVKDCLQWWAPIGRDRDVWIILAIYGVVQGLSLIHI